MKRKDGLLMREVVIALVIVVLLYLVGSGVLALVGGS